MAKFMKSGKMISESVSTYLAGIVFYNGDNPAQVENGALVTLGDLLADTTYADSGDYQYDVYKATAPVAGKEVAIVDLAKVNSITSGDNSYRVGLNQYNLMADANEVIRVRRLNLHDKYWIAAGNFSAEPTVGTFATVTASATTHTPAAELPASGFAVKVLLSRNFATGAEDGGKMFLVEVVQL